MTTRIDATQVIPGDGEPIANGSVLFDAATITWIGPTADLPADSPDLATEVETLMPGLWECHGHYFGINVPNIELALKVHPSLAGARAAQDLTATIMGGVTSVREMGGNGIYLSQAIDEGTLIGPSLYSAGAILSTTGGHADIHGYPLDFVESLVVRNVTFGAIADGIPECLKAVRMQLRKGARVIKVCASGGVMSEIDHPIHQQFSSGELEAIVEEAARAERIVGAHCHGKPGIMAALEAGVKTIEHGSYLDDEAAEAMIEADAILVPTRFVIAAILEMESTMPPYAYRKAVMIGDQHALALKIAVAAGVKIAMGTDIFFSGPLYGTHGLEIKYLVDAGMTPLEAIHAATAVGPETLGAQAPLSGQLRYGYDADLIALDWDPTDDVSGWGDPDRITHVWKSGNVVKAPVG